jgi:hypothetical protein
MRLSNSAMIRNCGASLSSSRGGVIALSFALLLMKHESLECVRRCLLFERNVCALTVCHRARFPPLPSRLTPGTGNLQTPYRPDRAAVA